MNDSNQTNKNRDLEDADVVKTEPETGEKDPGTHKKSKKRGCLRALKDVKKKLGKREAEVKENYDKMLRISAEFENFKKRSERELADFRKFASEEVLKEMLPIVDNLERAVDAAEDAGCEVVVEGLNMTLKQFYAGFEKFGVVPIESVGNQFDPRFHEAVMRDETSTEPGNIVLKELQKGYMIKDRLLRPSMVVVSAQPVTDDGLSASDNN